MQITYEAAFKRDYKKWKKQNPSKDRLLIQVISLFIQDPFHPLLKTHKLEGNLKDCYAFTVEYDLRIIFYFEDASHAVFLSLGSHDQVY